jgi:hypothetical protein
MERKAAAVVKFRDLQDIKAKRPAYENLIRNWIKYL